ncbi:MAG TPA: substrate-binding domain-containing protein [Candidatus Synoicihabitans sp.]|nr:substrate-binding domain-containing protein [Candidatus Synoicihabitans sp.]
MSVRQIAAALHLSPSAVSLALRHSPKIPAATRHRVLRQAEKIGYRPNAKLKEVMSHLRLAHVRPVEACFGVVSLYDSLRPWDGSAHLTRIFASMETRAAQLGYRLEPMRLRAPGMTHRRFKAILETRGIQGLLCFGSPRHEDAFPADLGAVATVTVGLSIATALHRVTSYFYNDLTHLLQRVHALGYRRPGLVLGRYEDHRSSHNYIGAYLAWCEQTFGGPVAPILRLDRVEEEPLLSWFRHYKPDVIVLVHLYDVLEEFQRLLIQHRIRVPQDVGVAAVSQILEGTGLSGMQQNQALMGSWAVELLVSRIMNQDFGLPTNPRIEMVESEWIDGRSLRSPRR